MVRVKRAMKIYMGLIVALALLAGINVFLPQGNFPSSLPDQGLPAPRPVLAIVNAFIMLIFYGGLGFLGLIFSQKIGFAELWDPKVSNKERFLFPMEAGLCIGLFFVLSDKIFSRFNSIGMLPHPSFPTSLVVSAIAGIGEEIVFRLFFIPFWVWLISYLLLKKRWMNPVFWIVSIFSSFIFAMGHLPSIMMLYGFKTIGEVPALLMVEVLLLNGVLSIVSAYHLRKYGFLASVGVHFWTDIVWHVIWGILYF